MFLPGTRLEPARAGTNATAVGLDTGRVVIDVDRLEVGVDVDRLGPRLPPARSGVAEAAERHVRLGAVRRAVDRGDAGRDPGQELLPPVDARRPDRGRQAVPRVVRQLDRLLEPAHAVQRGDRPEELLLDGP